MSRAKDVRLFDTFETTKSAVPKSQPQAFATGSSKWDFMFRAATTAQSLAIERLVVSTLCPTSASSQHGAALEADLFATALRDHLVPTWRRLPWAASFMARRYRAAIESSLFGVPGLVNYVHSRRQWIDAHIASAAREGASQVLIIGAGFDTRSLRLAAGLPSLTVFEVDRGELISRKIQALESMPASLPTPCMPRFIPWDWSNPSALIPAITAQGFDPGEKCVVVMEGLLYHLNPEAVRAVLADVAALLAPGSLLLYDILHQDAFEGSNKMHSGYSTLAKAMANKGEPFRSGQPATFASQSKLAMDFHLRVIELLSPTDIAARIMHPQEGNFVKDSTSRTTGAAADDGWLPTASDASSARCACSLQLRPASAPLPPKVPSFYSLVACVKMQHRFSLKAVVAKEPPRGDQGGKRGQHKDSIDSVSAEDNAFFFGPFSGCVSSFDRLKTLIWGQDGEGDDGPVSFRMAAPSGLPHSSYPSPCARTAEASRAASSVQAASLESHRSGDWALSVAKSANDGERRRRSEAYTPPASPWSAAQVASAAASRTLHTAISLDTQHRGGNSDATQGVKPFPFS